MHTVCDQSNICEGLVMHTHATDRLLRQPDVVARVGLSRSRIWDLVREGRLPPPRRISARAVAWLASEIDEWIASRPSALDARAPRPGERAPRSV